MNSSGIRALATLVLVAKAKGTLLHVIVSEEVPWQKKTVASFRTISPGLTIELRTRH